MSLRRISLVAPALAVLAAACGSDAIGPSDITQADFQGQWTVTKYEYVKDNDNGKHFDLIGDGHYTITATVQANGAYQLKFDRSGAPSSFATGVITVANGGITVTPSGEVAQPIAPTLDGKTLTFKEEIVSFDFNNDGTIQSPGDEDANLNMVWEKQQ